jgi:hypothetical protein
MDEFSGRTTCPIIAYLAIRAPAFLTVQVPWLPVKLSNHIEILLQSDYQYFILDIQLLRE